MRTVVRRRHRTWMLAMILATLGWSVWWGALALVRLKPEWAPPFWATYALAASFGAVGFFFAFFTIRARLIWVLLAGVPLFANGSLLVLPPLLGDLGVFEGIEKDATAVDHSQRNERSAL